MICADCDKVTFKLFTRYQDDGKPLQVCERCNARRDTNSEMIVLADLISSEVKGETRNIGGFDFIISESVPVDNIYIVPDRETLEKVQAERPEADLRRYFGMIKNVGMQ